MPGEQNSGNAEKRNALVNEVRRRLIALALEFRSDDFAIEKNLAEFRANGTLDANGFLKFFDGGHARH